LARRQTRQFPTQRRRANRDWAGIVSTAFVAVPAASKVLLGTFVLANPGIDETILRTVGVLTVQSDQAAASENQLGAIGMRIVTDRAGTVGITAIPDPVTEVSDDGWFMYQGFAQAFTFLDSTGFDSDAGHTYAIDSSAKRVLEDGSRIAIVVANASSSHGLQVAIVLRLLAMVRGT